MDSQSVKYPDLFDYILQEEQNFKNSTVSLGSNWEWNMWKHVDNSFLIKNSKFVTGDNEGFTRVFKQIILPILNVSYRTEGFNVDRVQAYVNDPDYYHMSHIANKYHRKWALENGIDKEIDASCVSYVDYGLTLVKDVNDKKPQAVDLMSLAFCNQSDILSGPICLKYNYSIDDLLSMKDKWDKDAVDTVIRKATFTINVDGKVSSTPNKNIEVYELHGVFPKSYLTGNPEDTEHKRQMFIVAYYKDDKSEKKGVYLFKGPQKQLFRALKRDDIWGRACGRGGIEEIMPEQVWTNYSMLQLKKLLDTLGMILWKTNDPTLGQRHDLKNLRHNTVLTLQDGKDFNAVAMPNPNINAFQLFSTLMEQNARTTGSASDPQLGLNPVSGTPLGTTQIVTAQGGGIHQYRAQQFADFWNKIYEEDITKYLISDLSRGDKWLEELSLKELQEVAEKVAVNEANDRIKEGLLKGKTITKEGQDALIDFIKQEFVKGGKTRFIEAMKDEFKELPIKMKWNVNNTNDDFISDVSKLNNIMRLALTNPQALSNPEIAELFNQILEKSGLSPIDFTGLTKKAIISPMSQDMSQPMNQPMPQNVPPTNGNLLNNASQ